MTPGQFLRELWGSWEEQVGSAVIWLAPGAESLHVPVAAIHGWDDEDDAEFLTYTAGRNAYTSPGLRVDGLPSYGKGSQGTQANIIALAGFVLDVDLKGGKHVASELPETDEDVATILEAGPDPTLVVSTGGGLHAWWLFERPWPLSDAHERKRARRAFQEFQDRYIKRGAEHGFHIDSTATIQHVFRLPGTQNYKQTVPRPVEVIYRGGPRYPREDLVVTRSRTSAEPFERTEPVQTLSPNSDGLDEVRAYMRRVHPTHRNKKIIEAILVGESFAERGERDHAMQRAVSTIAWLSPARGKTPEELAEILRSSLAVWAAEPEAEKTVEEELEKAAEKFSRAIVERDEKDAEAAKVLAPIRRFLRLESTTQEATPDAVADHELEQFAIIQHKSSFWAQSFGGQSTYVIKPGYHGPFSQADLLVQLGSLWEGAPEQFSLTYFNDKDEEKAKTLQRVCLEYATGAHDVLGHFALQESYFDPATRVYHEAICPIRPLEPRFDPQVDEWLHLLGGEFAEQLQDWIAAVTQLNYQCCALYLAGPPDCGKSLIATGLARLWHVGGATPLGNVMGSFNAEMFRCPLINLDEGLPDRSYKNVSSFLRSLVGSSTHTYNQKHVITRKVVGAIRLLISANNDNVLKFSDEELSALDLEAIVGRFLHIRVSDNAAKFIADRNEGRRMTERWVEGDDLARHALWLRDNRTLNPGRRFLVEGEPTAMHRALVTQGRWNGIVLEWLARFMTDPDKIDYAYRGKQALCRARVGSQKLLINTQGVIDGWDLYLANTSERLSTNAVGRVLNQLSNSYKPKLGKAGSERAHFHLVDADLVFSWAEENQVGDLERMQSNFTRQIDIEEEEEST